MQQKHKQLLGKILIVWALLSLCITLFYQFVVNAVMTVPLQYQAFTQVVQVIFNPFCRMFFIADVLGYYGIAFVFFPYIGALISIGIYLIRTKK